MQKYLRTLWQFTGLDLRQSYFRKYFILVEMVSLFLTILIYYYSAKAFVPREGSDLNFYGADLFSFLFWGDLVLRIPQSFFFSPVNNLKNAINDKTFESLIIHSGSEQLIFLSLSIMQLMRELITAVVMILMAYFFFGLQITGSGMLKIVFLTLAFSPLYVSIGIFMSALIFRVEKGEGVLYLFSNVLAILAGMYFPVEVFPEVLQKIGLYLSPYSYFLKIARSILSGDSLGPNLILIFFFGIVSYFLSIILIKRVYLGKKIRGDSLLMG